MGQLCTSTSTATNTPVDHSSNIYNNITDNDETDESNWSSSLHTEPINGLTFTDDTSLLITSCNDRGLYVYNWKEHELKSALAMPRKSPTKVIYNISSQWIHAGSRCGQVCSWKWPLKVGVVNSTLPRPPDMILSEHNVKVTALACDKDYDHLLMTGSRDNTVKVWDISQNKLLLSNEISRNLVTDMKWIQSECNVLQSSEDKTLRLWDVRTCNVVMTTPLKRHIQLCCSVSECGKYFISGSDGQEREGGEITVWDRRNVATPLQLLYGHSASVNSCMYHNHGNSELIIVSCSSDGNVKIWNQSTGECLVIEYISDAGPLTDLTSSNDLIACSSFKGGVRVWGCGQDNELILRAKY